MAIAITGPVPKPKHAYVFTITGAKTDDPLKPVYWNCTNVVDGRVGDWSPKAEGEADDAVVTRNADQSKFTIFLQETKHHKDTGKDKAYTIRCQAYDDTSKKYEEAKKTGNHIFTWTEPTPDYTFGAGVPYNPDNSNKITYVVHESDDPIATKITLPFNTTYPNSDYVHKITQSGDSSFYWDLGGHIVDTVTPSKNSISASMDIHYWAPHADYTGYITVSVVGHVKTTPDVDGTPAEVLAQDGYLIFIEYHTGTAISVRVLKANENDVLIDANGNTILTSGRE